MTIPAPLAPGALLGPYRIVNVLGQGGMGVVYRARDDRLQRDVALKVLAPGATTDPDTLKRFHRESLALAKLTHPGIAAIYDVGEQDGVLYLVMELVPGESLASRISRGGLPVDLVLAIGAEVTAALEEAHAHGIVHRDLKPANIMLTPKQHAKVLDFGIAKLFSTTSTGESAIAITETRDRIGTPLYMSPEQAFGEAIDHRTDIWSVGVVLYEALTGASPFQGTLPLAILRAVSQDQPASLRERRSDIPAAVERVVNRALAKNPSERYQSAAEMREALVALAAPAAAPSGHPRARMAALAGLLALVLTVGGWLYHRTERRTWAREKALPSVVALRQGYRWLAAEQLLQQAGDWLPGDSDVARLRAGSEREIAVSSTPAGATVQIADYLSPDSEWVTLGVTPILHVMVPRGYFRWRLLQPGRPARVTAPSTDSVMYFALDSAAAAPPGAVWVPGGEYADFIDFIGWIGPFRLPSAYVDQYEVSNGEYQRFVDSGGYRKPEYWTAPFADDGHTLSWEQAVGRFRDSSGRPGPATWQGGHFPEGRGNYPVSGISWFEASAYARWAGRSLPTMAQWYRMAPNDQMLYAILASNIGRDSVAPVGAFHGVGPYGTYDMGGNVREWVSNTYAARRHFLLGGAWNSQPYLYSEPEALSPFDRSPENGLRTLRNLGPLAAEVTAPVKVIGRDFAHARPASDEVFRTYQGLYDYDRTPLNAKVESVSGDSATGRIERVTFDAGYGHQRVPAYLFLPARVRPPYQAVLFFPSARVLGLPDSHTLADTGFFADIVRSGRAVLYPIYQGTYERSLPNLVVGAAQEVELRVQRYRDAARSLDYLASRGDIDTTKLAYLGVSMGAAEGVVYATLLQERLKAVLLLDGGFFLDTPSTAGDQVDFAPRLTRPVLMVNGRYDFSFSLDRAQVPLFRMLGTPAADKRHVILETPHDVTADRAGMKQATLEWLDRYLGRIE